MKRKLIFCLTFVLLVLASSITCFAAFESIQVYLDDKLLKFDVQPALVDGRTMVPMRTIFEELGATVEWDGATETITAKKDSTTIIMQLNNRNMRVNGDNIYLDVAPFETGGRTLVPVRAVAESFGVDVTWNQVAETVYISTKKQEESNFQIDFVDFSHGSINRPFVYGMVFGPYSEFNTISYQPTPEDSVKEIRIASSSEMLTGKDAEAFAKDAVGRSEGTCGPNEEWRIYYLELEYVSGTGPLVLGELFSSDNLHHTNGDPYNPLKVYFQVGDVYEDGDTKKTIEPGKSVIVKFLVLGDKNPYSPLLSIKYNGAVKSWWMHLDTSIEESDLAYYNYSATSSTDWYTVYDAPDFAYVSQLPVTNIVETNMSCAYIYAYNQTLIDEYYRILANYDWNLLGTEHNVTVTHYFEKRGKRMLCTENITDGTFIVSFSK